MASIRRAVCGFSSTSAGWTVAGPALRSWSWGRSLSQPLESLGDRPKGRPGFGASFTQYPRLICSLDGMFGCRAFIQGIVRQKKAEWSCGSSEPCSDLLCPPSGCSWKSGASEGCLGSPLGHLQSPRSQAASRSLKRGHTGTFIPVARAHWSTHRVPGAGVGGGGEGTRAET